MAMDALEKDRTRRKMATKMVAFLNGADTADCVSGHWYVKAHACELCDDTHAQELVVIKNRAHKKMLVAVTCIKEMIRFQVLQNVTELSKWLERIPALKIEEEKRQEQLKVERDEQRKLLERKVIVRKRPDAIK